MSKRYVLTLLLVLLAIILSALPKNDWEVQGLKGKVQSVQTEDKTQYFNKAGYLLSEHYTYGEVFVNVSYYTYDKAGHLISLETKDDSQNYAEGTYYTYNQEGLLSEEKSNSWGYDQTIKYAYNDKKQIVWKKTYDDDEELYEAVEYTYDKKGNKIKETHYDSDMQIKDYTAYSYDKKKCLLESRVYIDENEMVSNIIYKYNARKQLIEETHFIGKALILTEQNSYDKKANLTETVITYYGEDEHTITTASYAYDTKGNWITMAVSADEEHSQTSRRIISYF